MAAQLTKLVGLPEVTVSPTDCWMPYGKPVLTSGHWDKRPANEARLDRDDGFVLPELQHQLRNWWLASSGSANTPNWDLASTCHIDGKEGLLLVEAKAHVEELSPGGKAPPAPNSANSRANHERIGQAIQRANAGLGDATGGSWHLSRDHHYQLSNRFAWAWKLATLGVPTVLVYLGFLKAQEMEEMSALFFTTADWERHVTDHASGVVDASCWEKRLAVNGTPLVALLRAIDIPFMSRTPATIDGCTTTLL